MVNFKRGDPCEIKFDLEFKRPWDVSTLRTESLKVELCGQFFDSELQKRLNSKTDHQGCLILQTEVPQQISTAESVNIHVLIVVITTMTYFLVLELLVKTVTTVNKKSILKNGESIILMGHLISVTKNIPGAPKQFNQELMQILKYNFFYASQFADWVFGKQSALSNTGLDTAGYYCESTVHNMGSVIVFLALTPVIHLLLLLAYCAIRIKRIKEDSARVTKAWFYLSQNTNSKMYINLIVGFQPVLICSGLIYLWYTKSFEWTRVVTVYIKAKKHVRKQTDIQLNFFIAIALLSLNLVLYCALLLVVWCMGWCNLDKSLHG